MRHREVWKRTASAPCSTQTRAGWCCARGAAPRWRQLPDATALDGELIVWKDDRLAFERLLTAATPGAAAARAAEDWTAPFVGFDLLRLSGTDTTAWPYRRRRAALESMFAARGLSTPLTRPRRPPTPTPSTNG
ncbi:hypothetical protein ABZV34_32025 [Streptomyces sp. NPDC005195]|uniref:ATP-dependent DNA ligase n=1 Tax=Streptomyces sp. NPDC005195 TaxID=3154561 RepID=UPI0033BE187D